MLSRVGTANDRRVAAGGTGHLEVVSAARTRPYEGTGRGGLSHDQGVKVESGNHEFEHYKSVNKTMPTPLW